MSSKRVSAEYTLTLGRIPGRKRQYLGLQHGTVWTPLAQFVTDEAADRFREIATLAGWMAEEEDDS